MNVSLQYCEELLRKEGLLAPDRDLPRKFSGEVILTTEQRTFLEKHARVLYQQLLGKKLEAREVALRKAKAKRERKWAKNAKNR